MVGQMKDDINEKGLSADAVYDHATWRQRGDTYFQEQHTERRPYCYMLQSLVK